MHNVRYKSHSRTWQVAALQDIQCRSKDLLVAMKASLKMGNKRLTVRSARSGCISVQPKRLTFLATPVPSGASQSAQRVQLRGRCAFAGCTYCQPNSSLTKFEIGTAALLLFCHELLHMLCLNPGRPFLRM